VFLLKLLQIIFLLFFGYLIYQAVRFFVTLSRHSRDARRRMEEERDNREKRASGEKGQIIELDKDQYKVD